MKARMTWALKLPDNPFGIRFVCQDGAPKLFRSRRAGVAWLRAAIGRARGNGTPVRVKVVVVSR